MKKVCACLVLMVLCIIAAVLLRKPMDEAEADYTVVKARVVSSEEKTKRVKSGGTSSNITTYEVIVRYDGQEYELKNAHNAYSYRTGAETEAYLYNGKLYANIEGVKSATPAGKAYFAALIGAFGSFILSMLFLAKSGKKKGEELL